MLSPSTSSFLEDETFWGFPAGNVKGGEGWERLTRPFWVNFIVATSLPFWPRFTLEAALASLWSFIALGNEVSSPPPRQQAACGHVVGASHRAECVLVLPMEPECSGYEGEPTPGWWRGQVLRRGVCVCMLARGPCGVRVLPNNLVQL